MPATTESSQVDPSEVSGASRKLRELLRKRLRQLARLALVLALAAGAFAIWRLTSLRGLPDLGDPFDLVVLLATELFHRERGAPPPSEEALVGTYLEDLPDDGSAELDDGTAPTVTSSPSFIETRRR
jgi:hypothetical protein